MNGYELAYDTTDTFIFSAVCLKISPQKSLISHLVKATVQTTC